MWPKFGNLRTGTRYSTEILHQCRKRVKTKSQKVLRAYFNICRVKDKTFQKENVGQTTAVNGKDNIIRYQYFQN